MRTTHTVISLRLCGDNLDPTEVTRILACQPTEAHLKGGDITSQHFIREAPTGVWLRRGADDTGNLDARIISLLDVMTSDLEAWAALSRKHRIEVLCGVFCESKNESISLSAETLSVLARRGIALSCDIYCIDGA